MIQIGHGWHDVRSLPDFVIKIESQFLALADQILRYARVENEHFLHGCSFFLNHTIPGVSEHLLGFNITYSKTLCSARRRESATESRTSARDCGRPAARPLHDRRTGCRRRSR